MIEIIAQMERPANQIIDAAFRDQQRRKLSLVFGIEIRRVEKHLKKKRPPSYTIVTSAGDLVLKGVNQLITKHYLSNHMADLTGVILPRMTQQAWFTIVQALLDACEEIPAS